MIKKGNIRVYFNNLSIVRSIVRYIHSAEKVRACVAWCTNEKILDAFETTDTELIMTRARCNKFKRHIKVKFVGSGRGRKKTLMHHKFLVGFKDNKPSFVLTGSFNYTKSAVRHHENLVVIEDEDIAGAFYDEFLKLKNI